MKAFGVASDRGKSESKPYHIPGGIAEISMTIQDLIDDRGGGCHLVSL